jgi:hypothetical protein
MIAQLTTGRSGGAVAEIDHSDYACDILMSTNSTPSKYRARRISERPIVATLALGSRPKQGGCKVAGQEGDPGALHMLLGVQREWGNEPSHSQVNSHVGSWSPERTPEFSECDCKSQNSLPWRVLYTIRKILKCRCLKWARIAHLDIWNTSYGQKKGQESNWQFDSRPLKVKNRPDSLACRQHATYF